MYNHRKESKNDNIRCRFCTFNQPNNNIHGINTIKDSIWKHLLVLEAYSPMKRLVRNRTRTARGNGQNEKQQNESLASLHSQPLQVVGVGETLPLFTPSGNNRVWNWSSETIASHEKLRGFTGRSVCIFGKAKWLYSSSLCSVSKLRATYKTDRRGQICSHWQSASIKCWNLQGWWWSWASLKSCTHSGTKKLI